MHLEVQFILFLVFPICSSWVLLAPRGRQGAHFLSFGTRFWAMLLDFVAITSSFQCLSRGGVTTIVSLLLRDGHSFRSHSTHVRAPRDRSPRAMQSPYLIDLSFRVREPTLRSTHFVQLSAWRLGSSHPREIFAPGGHVALMGV